MELMNRIIKMNTLIVLPARVASTRLARKMLADIHGKPLIVRTFESAMAANIGDVIVACDGTEITETIKNAGGRAVLTDPDLPSGTDRVFAAWTQYDPNGKYEFIINLQGDLPFITPDFIRVVDEIIRKTNYDISTAATPIKDDSYERNSVVKPIISFTSENSGKALYFSRSPIPFGGPYYHHVGIYGFRSAGLRKFVNLAQSPLEKQEKLEQLRAMENDMTIGIAVVDQDPPISVDTFDDLEMARSAKNIGK
jgi:3-deoxy-manno-octulosonate cytidylyltransferase (CMP-KDO synthetase)